MMFLKRWANLHPLWFTFVMGLLVETGYPEETIIENERKAQS
jgi:hypothetical protein